MRPLSGRSRSEPWPAIRNPTRTFERRIWLEERWLDKLNFIRRSEESYSEPIIRLAALWEGHWTHKRR
jgi:hypothetical protein